MGLCYVGKHRWFNPSLITPSTGEAEPIGSSCVLYDTYNTFCTIHIRNIGRYEWASVVCRKAQVVQSLCPYIHGVSSLVETLYGIWILARVLGQSPKPTALRGIEMRVSLLDSRLPAIAVWEKFGGSVGRNSG